MSSGNTIAGQKPCIARVAGLSAPCVSSVFLLRCGLVPSAEQVVTLMVTRFSSTSSFTCAVSFFVLHDYTLCDIFINDEPHPAFVADPDDLNFLQRKTLESISLQLYNINVIIRYFMFKSHNRHSDTHIFVPVADEPHDDCAKQGITQCQLPENIGMMEQIFLGCKTSGCSTSAFHANEEQLKAAFVLHGITFHDTESLRHNRIAYLQHIINGSCFGREFTACTAITANVSIDDYIMVSHALVTETKSKELPTNDLLTIAEAVGVHGPFPSHRNIRHKLVRVIRNAMNANFHADEVISVTFDPLHSLFASFSNLKKDQLAALFVAHGLTQRAAAKKEEMKNELLEHVSRGQCTSLTAFACVEMVNTVSEGAQGLDHAMLHVTILRAVRDIAPRSVLQAVIAILEPSPTDHLTLSACKQKLTTIINNLEKARVAAGRQALINADAKAQQDAIDNWPTVLTDTQKEDIIDQFKAMTSSDALQRVVCASCAERVIKSDSIIVNESDVDLNPLTRPDQASCPEKCPADSMWLRDLAHDIPVPVALAHRPNIILDPKGVTVNDVTSEAVLCFCTECHSDLKRSKLPSLALANHMFIGDVPPELQGLTVVEEAMISLIRANIIVLQLSRDQNNSSKGAHNTQRGYTGHLCAFAQKPTELLNILPPTMDDLTASICIMFVGAQRPSKEWLRNKAKPLVVRRHVVLIALRYLMKHNIHYRDITIDYDRLSLYPEHDIIPAHVELVDSTQNDPAMTASYDPISHNAQPRTFDATEHHGTSETISATHPTAETTSTSNSSSVPEHIVNENETDDRARINQLSQDNADNSPIPFHNVVLADVDGFSSSTQMRAAAMRHVKYNKGAHVELPCGSKPVAEYCNPTLLPMIFPTLFPYGIGCPEDSSRVNAVSLKRHVKHLLTLRDRRFQEHPTFSFVAFSILQKRAINLHTSLRVKASHFDDFAASLAAIPDAVVEEVCRKASDGQHFKPKTAEEKKIAQLMNEVHVITSNVPCSSAAKIVQRNEIKALILKYNLPAFYVTINPADIYNPVVKILAGAEIDIDKMFPNDVPRYHEQSILVANNATVPAEFFHRYMDAFCKAVLSYDSDASIRKQGVLGYTDAYYGCVEAQGRGTLHCHMLIWVAGSYNVDEMKERVKHDPAFAKRVVEFMDDTISTSVPHVDNKPTVPSDHVHPSTLRGLNGETYDNDTLPRAKLADLHNVAEKSQRHKHNATCYKYCTNASEKKECRFDLGDHIQQLNSYFDPQSGDLMLRHLDGLVNNFNDTIIQCIRCNMDIKYIGSGPSTKAVLFYITDYITKTQLKSHVAYAALELAVKKLGTPNDEVDSVECRAKKLLQKCAFGMISKQELSAQQVASFLMDYGNHYTSHDFKQLYWTTAENYVEKSDPLTTVTPAECVDESEYDSDSDISEIDATERALISDDHDEESVGVTVSANGDIRKKPSQIEHYLNRGERLRPLSLWQYIQSIDKVTLFKKAPETDASSNKSAKTVYGGDDDIFHLLDGTDYNRPKFKYAAGHIDHETHLQQIVNARNRPVVVPIGPSMPREDHLESSNRYYRLMLILFKPWTRCFDLREEHASWKGAFDEFFAEKNYATTVMTNLHILNQCKDSRDDHFADRSRARQQANSANTTNHDDDNLGHNVLDDTDFLDHLVSSTETSCSRTYAQQRNISACLLNASVGNVTGSLFSAASQAMTSGQHVEIPASDNMLEKVWTKQYKDRKSEWKDTLKKANDNIEVPTGDDTVREPNISSYDSTHDMDVDIGPRINNAMDIDEHSETTPESESLADELINSYKLNDKQRAAFKLIVAHAEAGVGEAQLRMYLAGCSGTGKSTVIKALSSFFDKTNQARRLRLTAFTGAAAKNINGSTLHSSLMLDVKRSQSATRDLIAIWEGVDYLFIDEVSMIGCNLLRKIHLALCVAKESNKPFGGINIIFAGDFAQLPPVKDTRLYASTRFSKTATVKAQERVDAMLLWLLIDKVVILNDVMRQNGTEEYDFVQLLSRLRDGKCTIADYNTLSAKVVREDPLDVTDSHWDNTPIIVASNVVKDHLNQQMTVEYAHSTGQSVHYYYAKDDRLGKRVTHLGTVNKLRGLDSASSNQRYGALPLVIGMPVVLTQNLDAPHGIVNGSIGKLHAVRYVTEPNGERVATSCIVQFPDCDNSTMMSMDSPNCFPVVADSVNVQLTHDFSKKKITFKRTQLPIAPAFAFTAHKVQGQSFPSVVVDLQDCRGVEQPYVMISRVSSMRYLRILRPFDMAKITCNPSEERRTEFQRLAIAEDATRESAALSLRHDSAINDDVLQSSYEAQTRLLSSKYRSSAADAAPTAGPSRKRNAPDNQHTNRPTKKIRSAQTKA